MLISEVEVGQKIYLCYNTGDILDSNYEFVSQIADIIDDYQFTISPPFHKSEVVPLVPTDNLKVWFAHDNGLYLFSCEVKQIIYEEGPIFYRIFVTSDIQRLQRRAYYRIPIEIPLIYEIENGDKNIIGRGIAKDISGGGLKFICDEILENDQDIKIYLRLDAKFELNTEARVIRCVMVENKKYEISLLFNSLDYRQREDLVKYIFDVQRNTLKKK